MLSSLQNHNVQQEELYSPTAADVEVKPSYFCYWLDHCHTAMLIAAVDSCTVSVMQCGGGVVAV